MRGILTRSLPVILALAVMASAPALRARAVTSLKTYVGTWTGTSTCVGKRPACKNEVVVYRFVPVDGHPRQLRVLADKIIEGKRLPMGTLVFEFDEKTRGLECDFTRGNFHGIWSFAAEADSMTGMLVALPEREKERDVKVHRVKETDVPAAPALEEYEEH